MIMIQPTKFWFQIPTYWKKKEEEQYQSKLPTKEVAVSPVSKIEPIRKPMMSYDVQGTILPWVEDDKAQKIVEYVKTTAKTKEEEKYLLSDLHQQAVKKTQQTKYRDDREKNKSEMVKQSMSAKDPEEKKQMELSIKLSNISDIVRDWLGKQWIDARDVDDKEVVKRFITDNPDKQTMITDYLNWKLSSVDVGKQLGLIQEEVKEDNTATWLMDFLGGKKLDTSREISQFLDPLGTKGTGWADPSTALNLVGKTVLNIIPNTVEFAKWIWSLIFHPKQTVEWLKSLWQGIIDLAQWDTESPQAQMASWMWDSIKNTVTDPQKLGEWITENPVDIISVLSPKSVATAWEAIVKWTAKWISKWVKVLSKWTAKATEFAAAQAFGINPSTIKNIIKDPALYNKVEQWVINSEELLGSLGSKIDDSIAKISETGKWYQTIKETAKIKTPIDDINNSLAKRGIEIKDGKLDFTNTNMADTADLNAIQKAYDIVNTPEVNVINMRGKLDDLINYESKATSKWQSVVKEMRNAIDTKAKKDIPWLAELDASYSEQTKLLRSIKKDFLNPDWTFKDNAMSRISNLTKKGNEAKLERVKELIPWIEDNINAIRAFEDVTLAWWQKVWSYLRWAGTVGVWAMTAWPVGAIIWLLITSPQVATNLLKWLWYTKQFISWLTKNMKLWIKLTPAQIKVLEKWALGIPAWWIVWKDLLNNQ